jgi:hypothetical protein
MLSHTQLIGCIGISAVLCSCTTPKHTDLLVFGTNTQFGIDVGTNASSTTSLTIGFKRQEAVLMPLLANGQDSLYVPKSATAIDPKYLGQDSTTAKSDTYSVLAVFGASGSADTTATAKVGIAQYFATGLAARTLAIAGGSLVNTGNSAAEASKMTSANAAQVTAALQAIHTTPVDILVTGAPLDQAYLNLKANPEKEKIFNAAVQPAFKDYADFSEHRTTIDQVNKVKAELEKDADIKAEIEKDTPKK